MSEHAMEVLRKAYDAYCEDAEFSFDLCDVGENEAAAAIIAQALAAARKTRDAEICAWLRADAAELAETRHPMNVIGAEAISECADAIERGEV